MVSADPTIDPVTGLPLLNPNTPIQQIPLGQDVFPYADLLATAAPSRGPIYGDDIIPTSGLVTAPDKNLKPRSIQSTTTRELRVREAVFQSNGAPIPDGTTAPIDVRNVGGGGGGGNAPVQYTCLNLQKTMIAGSSDAPITNITYMCKTLYGFEYAWWSDTALGGVAFYSVALKMFDTLGNDPNTYTLWRSGVQPQATLHGQGDFLLTVFKMFPFPWDLTKYNAAGIGINFMLTVGNNFNESNNLVLYYT